ncbi:MAG: hypothetical protein ACE5IR_28315 [bacterium]
MKIKKIHSGNGLEILVGRDDRSNDALTFSVGRAQDVWLHASGASGSHVILPSGFIPANLIFKEQRHLMEKNLFCSTSLISWLLKLLTILNG